MTADLYRSIPILAKTSMSLFCFLAASCTQPFPTDATVLVNSGSSYATLHYAVWCGVSVRARGARGVRGAVRCGVSVLAVRAVRAVRCFMTLAVSAPRAVRAVRAVRCFVTPHKFTPKLLLPLRRSPPPSNTPILLHSRPLTASGSNQPFCRSTLFGQTDRPTNGLGDSPFRERLRSLY